MAAEKKPKAVKADNRKTVAQITKEINGRKAEIKELETKLLTEDEQSTIDYYNQRILNIKFGITWCNWFLNIDEL